MGRNSPKLAFAMSVSLDVPELYHRCYVVVHGSVLSPHFLHRSSVVLVPLLLMPQESSMLRLCFLYGEESFVGAGEEGVGFMVVVSSECIGGVAPGFLEQNQIHTICEPRMSNLTYSYKYG